MKKCLNLEYDVVLSFAGEDRKYVQETANFLQKSGIKVFYDLYEDVNLWGKDLYQHLDNVYQNKAKYAVIFISENYRKKLWTNHELRSAQARAFSESEEYILPARFDDTEIPGIRKTIGYLSLKDLTPIQFAKKIIKKLGTIEPKEFLPEEINYIHDVFDNLFDGYEYQDIEYLVAYVFNILKLTTDKERDFLSYFASHTCKHDISEDFHEDITLIQRVSGFDRVEIMEILKNLSNLGFEYKITKTINGCKEEGNELTYELLSLKLESRDPELVLHNLTLILALMYFGAVQGQCESCATKSLKRLDFSELKRKADDEELEFINQCIPDNEDLDDEEIEEQK